SANKRSSYLAPPAPPPLTPPSSASSSEVEDDVPLALLPQSQHLRPPSPYGDPSRPAISRARSFDISRSTYPTQQSYYDPNHSPPASPFIVTRPKHTSAPIAPMPYPTHNMPYPGTPPNPYPSPVPSQQQMHQYPFPAQPQPQQQAYATVYPQQPIPTIQQPMPMMPLVQLGPGDLPKTSLRDDRKRRNRSSSFGGSVVTVPASAAALGYVNMTPTPPPPPPHQMHYGMQLMPPPVMHRAPSPQPRVVTPPPQANPAVAAWVQAQTAGADGGGLSGQRKSWLGN
ncbi:hypothetical protein HK104_001257, partial [Borealophlyctis nickersoniae]